TRTRLTIGACSVPSRRAYSSGLPGMFARSFTAAGAIELPWTTAALMVSVGVALMNVVSVFASATGSVSVYTTAVIPVKCFSSDRNEVALVGGLGRELLTTLYRPFALRIWRRKSVTCGTVSPL